MGTGFSSGLMTGPSNRWRWWSHDSANMLPSPHIFKKWALRCVNEISIKLLFKDKKRKRKTGLKRLPRGEPSQSGTLCLVGFPSRHRVSPGFDFWHAVAWKRAGWKILADLGDDCEREKGILGQDVRMRMGPRPRAATPSGDRRGPHVREGHLPPQTPGPGDAAGAPGARPDRVRGPAQLRPHSPDATDGLDVQAQLQLHRAVHGDARDL